MLPMKTKIFYWSDWQGAGYRLNQYNEHGYSAISAPFEQLWDCICFAMSHVKHVDEIRG